MVESFAYAPWVVLFSLLLFIIFYGGCILGQQIMKLSETGKDSLILFSTERTYRSWSNTFDYVLLCTRFVSFAYLLGVPIIYGTITYTNMYNLWFSFRIWNVLLVELFFMFSLFNSIVGLFVAETSRCCLSSSSNNGYYYYAFFMQMLFVISGATSLFIAVVMYWYNDNSTSLLNMSYNVSPAVFMVVELYLDKYYVRFNHYWLNFVYLYFYIFFIWIIVAANRLDFFPYTAMGLADANALLGYFAIISFNFVTYSVWYGFSEIKVLLHNHLDTRIQSAFIDDSDHDHDQLMASRDGAPNSSI